MKNETKNLITKIIIGLLIFLVALFVIEVFGQFLSYFIVRAAIALIIAWAFVSNGEKLGLPGFAKAKKK